MHSAVDYVADYATNNWTKSIARLMKRCANNPIIVNYLRSAHVEVNMRRCRRFTGTSALKKKR